MQISQRGLTLIESFEGFTSRAFLDIIARPPVWTVGFGETQGVSSSTTMTRAQAGVILARHVNDRYAPAVNALHVPLNQNQFDALVSLCYNCGPGAMQWQIGSDLKAHNYKKAADDFMRYVFAGGVRIQGLVNRRSAERALFLTPVATPDPHHYERFDKTVRHFKQYPDRHMDEHATVIEYDVKRAQWKKYPARLQRLRENCGILADRITQMGDLDKYNRRWRRTQLLARKSGARWPTGMN